MLSSNHNRASVGGEQEGVQQRVVDIWLKRGVRVEEGEKMNWRRERENVFLLILKAGLKKPS